MAHSVRRALLLAACALLSSRFAGAQSSIFPKQIVRIYVPFAAGGPLDQTARILAQKLNELWQQSVIIENRTGASGIVAAEATMRMPADGYTILFSAISHSVLPSIKQGLTYDIEKDFTPLSLVAIYPVILVINGASPIKTLAELIAQAKSSSNKLTYATSGKGSISHLSGELFKMRGGVDLVDVPYAGSSAAILDVLGGRVDMMFCDIPTALQHVQSGRLRALGISTKERSPLFPSLSPINSALVPDYESIGWGGLSVRAGTPAEVVAKLNQGIVASLQDPEIREKLLKIGADPIPQTSAQYGTFIHNERIKWAQVVRIANIKMD